MDRDRFDRFARILGAAATRRAALRALAALGTGGAVAAPGGAAARGKCPKGQKRCGKKCIAKGKCCTTKDCATGPGAVANTVCAKASGRCVCKAGLVRCPAPSNYCAQCCVQGECPGEQVCGHAGIDDATGVINRCCLPAGAACEVGGQCCGGTCTRGACTCSPVSYGCAADEHCCNGECSSDGVLHGGCNA